VRPPVLLSRCRKPWAVLSLQVPTVHRAIEWAMQVPWLHRLKAVFSDEWGCEFDSLPGSMGEGALKLVKLFVIVIEANLHSKSPD